MELTLFGGFQLVDAATSPITVSARKVKALLAWLAMHQGRHQPRERLALLLWEESDEVQARHSLRQALSGLRKVLGLGCPARRGVARAGPYSGGCAAR